MSAISVVELASDQYPLYDAIPSQFQVESIYRLEQLDGRLGGLRLVEEQFEVPFTRDYNFSGADQPSSWVQNFDVSKWGFFVALEGSQPIGGAAVALEGDVFPARQLQRKDLAVLWDIRVRPERKNQGVGTNLFLQAASWAKNQGCGQLGLETDSSNVPACKFYARMGCELGGILKYGYSGVAEVAEYAMLLWYLDLTAFDASTVG